ncbi:hypothetical protein Sru01_08630 [Sphaerisporangium rufum]|uniref:Uncharacterized protein n=1 Tax=Sphaerisporangium rufum TaxID=1381558 RepID=A0A919UWC1_9ACTN|nr:hypothetical protein [Sphaerisporangium rufum]GII75881.1 hypothetical protein Sru01_08630 [Sphaerisporangium rufum]
MRRLLAVLGRLLIAAALLATGLAATAGPAGAAVPDNWGFALVDTTSGVPDPNHQAGSWPAPDVVTVFPGGPGQTYVKFPKIASKRGVAHVTAISQTGQWCQVQKWGPSGSDEIVVVQCYLYGGTPAWSRFTVVFEESSGALPAPEAFATIAWDGGSIISEYNSSLGVNTVTPTSTGVWTVWLPGVGSSGQAGDIQVTAVDSSAPARCKVSAWSPSLGGQKIQVRCHDATSIPYKTGWNLTYHRERAVTGAAIPPKYFGYVFDNMPANPGPYTPVPAGVSYNSVGSFNEIRSAAVGQRLVTFHKIGVLPDHVQVTAFGPGPEYCNLVTTWATYGMEVIVRNVVCYNGVTRVDQASMVTYTSAY